MIESSSARYAVRLGLDENAENQVRGLNPEVLERLRETVECFGGAAKIAKAIGVSQSSLSDNLSGRREPRASLVAALARVGGRSLDWIMFGSEPANGPGPPSLVPVPASADAVGIPYYNIRASAGPGVLSDHDEAVMRMEIDRRFMRLLGISPANAAILTVHGDSGQPNLSEGDAILIDRSLTELRDGGLYVIGIDEDVVVRRVQRQMDRSVILKSDNPAYVPQHISAAAADRLRVIGRVRWAIRQY